MKTKLLLLALTIMVSACSLKKNPNDSEAVIKKSQDFSAANDKGLVIFTGSSSIRKWNTLQEDCNGMQIMNTGFGGSKMSDLLQLIDQKILRFQPSKVYIYEGDNDIAAKVKPREIISTAERIVEKILAANSTTEIHFISAKPSPARWKYKDEYLNFNALLAEYCKTQEQLFYVDVWHPMLNADSIPNPDIFIYDKLHMNRKGYLLWKEVICDDSK